MCGERRLGFAVALGVVRICTAGRLVYAAGRHWYVAGRHGFIAGRHGGLMHLVPRHNYSL